VLISVVYPVLRKTVMAHAIYNPVVAYDPDSGPGFSLRHPLGVCCYGRDGLSLLLAATKPTFIVGVSAGLTTAIVGTAIGLAAAYARDNVDLLLVQISKAFLIIPAPIVMVLVGSRFRELSAIHLGIIYGLIAGLGGMAIVIRTQTLKVLVLPFISASRIAGSSGFHILKKHAFPHILPLIATYTTLAVRDAVIVDGFLSFFGFTRSYLNWGYIVYESGFSIASLSAVLMISLFAAAFYMISQGFRDLVDPRLRVN
jgi:peptide/nickel transport system permease protein